MKQETMNQKNNKRTSEFERADIPSQRLLPHQKLYITMAVAVLLLFSFVSLQKMHDGFGENLAGFVAGGPAITVTQDDLTTEFQFLHPGSNLRTGSAVRYGGKSYTFRNGKWNIPEAPAPARRAPAQRQAARAPAQPAAPAAPAELKLVPLDYGIDPDSGERRLFHVDAEGNIYMADKTLANPKGPTLLLKNTPAYAAAVRQARGESTTPTRVTASPPPPGTVPPSAPAAGPPSIPQQRFDAAHQEYLTAAHEATQASKRIAELNGRLRAAEEKLANNRVSANLDALNSLKAEYARLMPELTAQKQQTMARLEQAEAGRTAAEQALRGGAAPATAVASAAAPTPPPTAAPSASMTQQGFCIAYFGRCPADSAKAELEYKRFLKNPGDYDAKYAAAARAASAQQPPSMDIEEGMDITGQMPPAEKEGPRPPTPVVTRREEPGFNQALYEQKKKTYGNLDLTVLESIARADAAQSRLTPAEKQALQETLQAKRSAPSEEMTFPAMEVGPEFSESSEQGASTPPPRGGQSVGGEEAERATRLSPSEAAPRYESATPPESSAVTGDKIRVGNRDFIVDSFGNLFFDDPDPAKRRPVPKGVADAVEKTSPYKDVKNRIEERIAEAETRAQEGAAPSVAARSKIPIGTVNGVKVFRAPDGTFYDSHNKPITDPAIGRKAAEIFKEKKEEVTPEKQSARLALLEEVQEPGEQHEFTFEPDELPPADTVAGADETTEGEPLPPGSAGQQEPEPAPPRPIDVPGINAPAAGTSAPPPAAPKSGAALATDILNYCRGQLSGVDCIAQIAADPRNSCSSDTACLTAVTRLAGSLPAPLASEASPPTTSPSAGALPSTGVAPPSPVPAAAPSPPQQHTIAAGETLSKIARENNVKVDDLIVTFNGQQMTVKDAKAQGFNPDKIQVGMNVGIPSVGAAPSATVQPPAAGAQPPAGAAPPSAPPPGTPTPAAAAAEARTLEQLFAPTAITGETGTTPKATVDKLQSTCKDEGGKTICGSDANKFEKQGDSFVGIEGPFAGQTLTPGENGVLEIRNTQTGILERVIAPNGMPYNLGQIGAKEVKTNPDGSIASITFERPRSCKNGIILTLCSGGAEEATFDAATNTFKLKDGTTIQPSTTGVALVKNPDGSTSLMAPGPSGAPELLTTLGKEVTLQELKDSSGTVIGAKVVDSSGKVLQEINHQDMSITNRDDKGTVESRSRIVNGQRVFEEFDHKGGTSSLYCNGGTKCGFSLGCDAKTGVCASSGLMMSKDADGKLTPGCTLQQTNRCVIAGPDGKEISADEFCKNKGADCKKKLQDAATLPLSFFDAVTLANEGIQMANDVKNFCNLIGDKNDCDGIFGDIFGAEEFLNKLKKDDPVLAGLFTGDWEESICFKYLDRSKAEPGQEGFLYDFDGQLKLWIAAEKAFMPVPIEEGGLHNQQAMYYRINGEINPTKICQIDSPPPAEEPSNADIEKAFKNEFLVFTVWLVGRNGQTQIDPQKDGNPENDIFSPRCDSSGVSMIGQQTIVRVLPTNYDEVCVKFHNPGNVQGFVRDELEGGMFCNTIVQSSPEISQTTTPSGGSPTDERGQELGQIPEIRN